MSTSSRPAGSVARLWSRSQLWLRGSVRNRFRLIGAREDTETPVYSAVGGLAALVLAFVAFVAWRGLAARPPGTKWPSTVSWQGERGRIVVVSLPRLFTVLSAVALLALVVLVACLAAWRATSRSANSDGTDGW